ncbi:MAG: hypothetical protein MZV64_72445 [Ignavibacteriales bacterium]|nr:hypothetical protein [Ignavibacteriales bacterium]
MLIEKGDNITPESDFKQTMDPKYLLKYIKSLKGDGIQFTFAEGLGGVQVFMRWFLLEHLHRLLI